MKRSLNLIPIATQRRQALGRVSHVGSTATVIAGVFTALLLGIEWTRGMVAVQQLSELNARYAPFEEIAGKQSKLASQIEMLRAREQLSLRLSREARGLTLLGAIAKAAEQQGGGVFVEALEYEGSAADGTQAENGGEVRLNGAGTDSTAIALFAQSLRETGMFAEVAVQSTRPISGNNTSQRRFEVACTL